MHSGDDEDYKKQHTTECNSISFVSCSRSCYRGEESHRQVKVEVHIHAHAHLSAMAR